MCGIVGFSGSRSPEQLNAMLQCIIHRGPDDQALVETDKFSLGMRRLSIIDLSANIYPIKSEDEQIQVVYNGEIYNYQALREELKRKGHEFATKSDGEVIVHGYEEWGTELFSKLRGMYGIAIFDGRKNETLLVRDRLGIKPLYYSEHQGRIVFASEIKALFAGWDIDRSADDASVYKFLLTRVHDDTKHTFFQNVKKLLPGHFITIDQDGNYRSERYWFPKTVTDFKSEKTDQEYADMVREKFIETMKLHLITDVPLGVNLSGGLDSSSVVSVANKLLKEGTDLHTGNKLLTFSAVHPGETIDESEYIDQVVKFAGVQNYKVTPSLDKFWEEIDWWLFMQEEPVISTAPYAYSVVMREAKKHVTVLLSGQGGDELFAGYIPYFMSYINTAQDANAYMSILRESVRGFDLYAPFIREKIRTKFKKDKQLNVKELLNMDNFQKPAERNVFFTHRRNLNARLFEDLTATTVPSLLRYEDKNSMSHSLESRVPFLDHEFVELVFSIPASQKIKMGWNRYVWRNAMKDLIPENIRKRRSKIGFVNSEWEWLQAESQRILEIFGSDEFRARPYWDADKVIEQFKLWVAGEKEGDGLMFWRILNVELWLRRYVDNFKIQD